MSFHEVQLPPDISLGARGGPEFNTDVITFSSGTEKRNINWSHPRRRYNVAYGVRNGAQMQTVFDFFHARQGKAYGFRFKDWLDYNSKNPDSAATPTDQAIGTGNGVLTTFQLVKNYTSAAITYSRTIKKPVAGTVRVALAGGEVFSPAAWSVNTTTGIITFVSPPGNGVAVTAGYEFDTPVRFDTDWLPGTADSYGINSFADIPLIEVRL